MSEYQYYEFAAIDRPLTREQMSRLRALSTRATITPNSRGRSLIHGPAVTPAHSLLQPATRGRVRQDALPESRTTAVARRDGAPAHP